MRMKSLFSALGAFACAFAISFYYEWRLTLGTGLFPHLIYAYNMGGIGETDFSQKWRPGEPY